MVQTRKFDAAGDGACVLPRLLQSTIRNRRSERLLANLSSYSSFQNLTAMSLYIHFKLALEAGIWGRDPGDGRW
jgi:hypothetical protein